MIIRTNKKYLKDKIQKCKKLKYSYRTLEMFKEYKTSNSTGNVLFQNGNLYELYNSYEFLTKNEFILKNGFKFFNKLKDNFLSEDFFRFGNIGKLSKNNFPKKKKILEKNIKYIYNTGKIEGKIEGKIININIKKEYKNFKNFNIDMKNGLKGKNSIKYEDFLLFGIFSKEIFENYRFQNDDIKLIKDTYFFMFSNKVYLKIDKTFLFSNIENYILYKSIIKNNKKLILLDKNEVKFLLKNNILNNLEENIIYNYSDFLKLINKPNKNWEFIINDSCSKNKFGKKYENRKNRHINKAKNIDIIKKENISYKKKFS